MYVIMRADYQFFTGNQFQQNGQYPFLWNRQIGQAKRYQKYQWAQKAAGKWGGRVIPLKLGTVANDLPLTTWPQRPVRATENPRGK